MSSGGGGQASISSEKRQVLVLRVFDRLSLSQKKLEHLAEDSSVSQVQPVIRIGWQAMISDDLRVGDPIHRGVQRRHTSSGISPAVGDVVASVAAWGEESQ